MAKRLRPIHKKLKRAQKCAALRNDINRYYRALWAVAKGLEAVALAMEKNNARLAAPTFREMLTDPMRCQDFANHLKTSQPSPDKKGE